MKLSTKIRYGTRALVYIAAFGKNRYVSISEISEKENISLKYLENIMTLLKSSGLLRSMQGAGGGYYLAKSIDELTLADIMYSISGPIFLVRCLSEYECNREMECVLKDVWNDVNNVLDKKLRSIKLKNIVKKRKRKIKSFA